MVSVSCIAAREDEHEQHLNDALRAPWVPRNIKPPSGGPGWLRGVTVKSNQRLTTGQTLEFRPQVLYLLGIIFFYFWPTRLHQRKTTQEAGPRPPSTGVSEVCCLAHYALAAPSCGRGDVEAHSQTLPIISRGSVPWQDCSRFVILGGRDGGRVGSPPRSLGPAPLPSRARLHTTKGA